MRILSALLLLALLCSCALTSPRDVGKANMFTFSAPADITSDKHRQAVLKIRYPSVPSELDTYRIAVTTSDGRQDYIASARWSEFLPSVMQAALQEGFSRSQLFSYVDMDESAAASGYVLATEIQECRAIYGAGKAAPSVQLRVIFRLTEARSNRVVAKFVGEEVTPATANSLGAIARAFNAAFGAVLRGATEHFERKI